MTRSYPQAVDKWRSYQQSTVDNLRAFYIDPLFYLKNILKQRNRLVIHIIHTPY